MAAGASGGEFPSEEDRGADPAPEDLPFGRSTGDVFEDLDHAGGRHWAFTAVGVVVVLAVLLGGAYLAGSWYAGRTYYVTEQAGEVQIFRGQPGGFLIFDPSAEETSGLPVDELTAAQREELAAEPEFDSLQDARTRVNTWKTDADQRATEDQPPPTTTTEPSSSTTTTRPGARTTVPTTTEGP